MNHCAFGWGFDRLQDEAFELFRVFHEKPQREMGRAEPSAAPGGILASDFETAPEEALLHGDGGDLFRSSLRHSARKPEINLLRDEEKHFCRQQKTPIGDIERDGDKRRHLERDPVARQTGRGDRAKTSLEMEHHLIGQERRPPAYFVDYAHDSLGLRSGRGSPGVEDFELIRK
jgi:hypothetical protein